MLDFTVLSNPYFYMWAFVCLLQSLVTAWAFLRCFTVKCPKWAAYIAITVSLAVIPIAWKHLLPSMVAVTPILNLLLPMITCSFIAKNGKVRIIFFFIINLLMESIVEIMLHIVLSSRYHAINVFDLRKVVITTVFLFIITPLKYIFSLVWNKVANKKENKDVNWIFIVFPLAQALAYVSMMLQTAGWGVDSSKTFYFILAAMIIFAVSDILFLKFITDFEKKRTLEEELKIMEHTSQLEAMHYESIESKRYETAKIRHDIKNQIIAAKNLLTSGKIHDAEEIFGALEKNLDSTKEYEYCGIPIVNAVMGEKKIDCDKNGIEFSVDVSLRNSDEIEKYHICSVFSNLIDNAIKANLRSDIDECRYIKIKGINKERYFIISCENPVFGNVADGRIIPQKSSGYGLKILNDIATAYDGSFNIEVKDGICKASIVLKGRNIA